MVQITHVRAETTTSHEREITGIRWYDPQSGNMNIASVAGMVEFLGKGGRAYVCDGTSIVVFKS
jgi:hypothetical protein